MKPAGYFGQEAEGHYHCFEKHKTIEGSPDVFVEGCKALRVGDAVAHHGGSCSKHRTSHGGKADKGSTSVFVNGCPWPREGDTVKCATGQTAPLLQGRQSVLVGDASPVAGAQPSAEAGAQPSAEAGARPSAEAGAQPSAEAGARPSASSSTEPQPAWVKDYPGSQACVDIGPAARAAVAEAIAKKPENFPYRITLQSCGSVQVGDRIFIFNDAKRPLFQVEVLEALYKMSEYYSGQTLLARIQNPRHDRTVTISNFSDWNAHASWLPGKKLLASDPTQGTDAIVQVNPDYFQADDINNIKGANPTPWHVTLFHELKHANDIQNGTLDLTPVGGGWSTWGEVYAINGDPLKDKDGNIIYTWEAYKTGVFDYANAKKDPVSENMYRMEVGAWGNDNVCVLRTDHSIGVVSCPVHGSGPTP